MRGVDMGNGYNKPVENCLGGGKYCCYGKYIEFKYYQC